MRKNQSLSLSGIATALALLLSSIAPAHAGETGIAGYRDARIKTHVYDASEVYRVIGHFGYVTSIQFEPGEKVESIQLGDSVSWSVERLARGDMLSVVPVDDAARSTNMTVTTSARVYVFDMIARHAVRSDAPEMTFLYRFDYPVTAEELMARSKALAAIETAEAARVVRFEDIIARAKSTDKPLNTTYRASGAPFLRPVAMVDDGAKTYLQFPEGASRPAVFLVAPSGDEAAVNTSTLEDGTLVIHQTGRAFTLRGRDGSTVCIFNDRLMGLGAKKPPSISDPGPVRAVGINTGVVPAPSTEITATPLTFGNDRGPFTWERTTHAALRGFEGFDSGDQQ